jgi:CheY-like chemotaxis protein
MLNKVLFIDDDAVTLMLNRMLIEKTSFAREMLTAENGKVALDYYKDLLESPEEADSYPRLMFLDLNMPIMDGWEFLEEFTKPAFRQHFEETKIIVLSSSIDPADRERSQRYPMVVDFIRKPVTAEILEQLSAIE